MKTGEKKTQTSGFDPNDTTGMTINGKAFKIQKITGYSKEIRKLTGNLRELKDTTEEIKMPEIQEPKIEQPKFKITGYSTGGYENIVPNVKSFNLWEILRNKIEQIKPAIQQFKQSLRGISTDSKELELVKYKISEIEEKLENAKNGKIHLNTKEIIEAEAQLERLNNKKEKLEEGNKGNFFSGFFSGLKKVTPSMNGISGVTIKIKNQIKQWSGGIKNGLGHVLKYAGALFSLQSIYSTLSGCAQSWLSSQNAGAKQLSANIDYMKYAMGSAFAPVIQYVTGLVYQLMKAIQSVAYALTGVNIFAKASASSYASMASSAKSAKNETKQLAGVHDEINNVQSNDSSDSGNSGGVSPNFDLSGIDNQMSPLAQKLYDFFKPLVDSWNKYGSQVKEAFKNAINGVGQAISAMWNSVETLFTNGTIYSIIANILNSIGQIGTAWANAWNNGNNGTEIIQGIANMINDITNAILNLVSSTGFQSFLDGVLSTISGIVQFIEPIVEGSTEMAEKILEIVLSDIGDVLKTVGDALQSIAQNKTVSEILKAVGQAIAIVVGAIVLWNIAQAILNGLMGLFAILTSPITLIILAIIAAITAIILVVKNWGAISEWFQNLWVKITEKLQEIWNNIKLFFVNLWNSIMDKIKTVWNGIKEFLSNLWNGILNIVKTVFNAVATFFSNIWNGIKNVVSTVWNAIKNTISNVINGIKDTISNVLNGIKTVWNNIWTGLKTTVTNIFNGIWNTIKNIINSILGGIEGMANGIVNGINKVIDVLNNLQVHIPDWIPLFGGKDIGFHINHMGTVSLPRLAKGGVLTEATTIVAGEYSGARTNPEIVTPQNIMRDTFEDVLSDFNSCNGQPVHVTIQYLGKDIFDDTIDYINSKTRRTGKNTIVTVGD